ncbi:MAG: hypothetical protein IPM82_29885 [Saprospiraceae bacterium]|nr:hypothetical protein [Saprospiraceae bacterium]
MEFWLNSQSDHITDPNDGVVFGISDGNNYPNAQAFLIDYGNTTSAFSNERISIVRQALPANNQTMSCLLSNNTHTNQWHHFAVVCTGTNWLLYLDGILQSTVNKPLL